MFSFENKEVRAENKANEEVVREVSADDSVLVSGGNINGSAPIMDQL